MIFIDKVLCHIGNILCFKLKLRAQHAPENNDVDGARRCRTQISKGILDNYNMDEKECTASNFMQKERKEIICILIYCRHQISAKNGESTPLKNNASGRQTASRQDKKEVFSEEKLLNRK